MKKLAFLVAFVAIICSCCNQPKTNFTLKGELKNYPSEKIYLMYIDGNNADSLEVKDGKFIYKGSIDEPTSILLTSEPYSTRKAMNQPDMKLLYFFIDQAKMTLTADWSAQVNEMRSLPYTLTGSKTNDESIQITEMMNQNVDRNGMTETIVSFVENHPDSYISAHYLGTYSSMLPIDKIEELLGKLTDKAKSYSPCKEAQAEVDANRAIEVGKPAPEIIATDINGNPFKLSELKGKVVILDFWASWCKPCRASMPHVKALYNKYKKSGLVVVCIADDDSSNDKWKEAIKKDGTGEFYHMLRGLKVDEKGNFDRSSDLSDAYAVHYLPTKFLIGADGTIVGSKVNDEEIDAKLKEIFGF